MDRPAPRTAGPCDADLLAALHERCFRPDGGEVWDRASIAGLLGTPGCFAFIAVEEDAGPVGLVIARTAGAESEILTIGILPDNRRAGHGRALADAAAGHAAGKGAEVQFLEVAADNAAALALYADCGFRQVGRRPGYYRRGGGRVDAILLRRALAGPDERAG